MLHFENLSEGAVTSIVGMVIVFSVLIIISFVLSFLKRFGKEKVITQNPIAEEPQKLIVPTEITEQNDNVDDFELIAVITAVLAEALNTTPDKFFVHSVKKVSPWIQESKKNHQINNF